MAACCCSGFGADGMCACMRARLSAAEAPNPNFITLQFTATRDSVTFMEKSQPQHHLFSVRLKAQFEQVLDGIRKHVLGATYDPNYHYNKGDMQTIDKWHAKGTLNITALDTAQKYLDRYGSKEGKNPKDLLKAIHYILMVYFNDHIDTYNKGNASSS